MTTKKLTPVKQEAVEPASTQDAILLELQKHTEYLHRVDWKLWMIMNMFRTVGEENGYTFSVVHRDSDDTDKEIEK
jgi:hypothetical protein